jgi:hypothetical protein
MVLVGKTAAMGRERTGRATATAIVLVVGGVVAGTACSASDTGAADRVRPIDADRATAVPDVGPATPTTQPNSTTTITATTMEPATSAVDPTAVDASDADRAVIDDLLERYDRTLTDLAADPVAVSSLGHPLLIAWQSVVTPGTALAEDLPAAIMSRHAEGVVIRPGADGVSYRHRALQVIPAADGSVSFTWCAWSPGIGYDTATGAVVDDAVGHAHGTGRGHVVDGVWRLDSLDQSDLEALAPGTPDPCPAEAARVAGR